MLNRLLCVPSILLLLSLGTSVQHIGAGYVVIKTMTFPGILNLFRLQNQKYVNCVEQGGTVVSNLFCLPSAYRKDVLPPTGETSVDT